MVLDLKDALVGIDHPEVDHGVNPGGDVIAGDDVLGWDVHGDGPEVHLDHLVHHRQQDEQPWSLRPSLDAPEPEDDAPLVLLDYLDGAKYQRDDDDRDANQRYRLEPYPDRLQQFESHKIMLRFGLGGPR